MLKAAHGLLMLGLVLTGSVTHAQTRAEQCLAMRLAALGEAVSNALHCEAWAVATRTAASDPCVAHGHDEMARALRAADCASDDQIAAILDEARASTATLIGSQIVESRLAELDAGLWRTEAIVDFSRSYTPGLAWPDESCRSQGHCPHLIIVVCETTDRPDGTLDTLCQSAPESGVEVVDAPVVVAENTPLPTGQILSRGSTGLDYEMVVTLSDDGQRYTGTGWLGDTPMFLSGERIR